MSQAAGASTMAISTLKSKLIDLTADERAEVLAFGLSMVDKLALKAIAIKLEKRERETLMQVLAELTPSFIYQPYEPPQEDGLAEGADTNKTTEELILDTLQAIAVDVRSIAERQY